MGADGSSWCWMSDVRSGGSLVSRLLEPVHNENNDLRHVAACSV